MRIHQVQEYRSDPATVWRTLSDEDFLAGLCRSQQADSWTVDATESASRIEVTVPAPDQVRRFVGPKLIIHQDVEWDPPTPGTPTRTGLFSVEVPGAPVRAKGTVTIEVGGVGTLVEYEGELTARIPLFGRQVEQAAGDAFLDVLTAQHRLATSQLG